MSDATGQAGTGAEGQAGAGAGAGGPTAGTRAARQAGTRPAAEQPWRGRRLHFVGVGGSGMSGYARVAHALGATVSGSDRADSPYLWRLREEGVLEPAIGHDAANLPGGPDVEVVYSSAVPPENPERAAARERGLVEHPRAELLGELTGLRRTIAVAGAHGKTTTSAMIAWTLRELGCEPGWLIGSPIGARLENSHWGRGEWLVVEADESDRSMLSLNVEVAVLTNVELDHHATFSSLAELREAYAQFLALAGRAIVVWDRPELRALVERSHELAGAAAERSQAAAREVVPYDVAQPALSVAGSRFRWREREVAVSVPGAHNALNATAALEAVRLAGGDGAAAIAAFDGAGRRFQRLGRTASGTLVVDDYAHHPTEVQATIRAARTLGGERVVAVFQPHLYSRTAMLAREFGAALALADVVVVLDVYPARERAEDHPGVGGLLLAREAAERAGGRAVYWLPTLEQARTALAGMLQAGDVCLVMGAGDVDGLAHGLAADG
jgi:UDP-N-acetylmuramate--alanine ligase